MVKKILDVITNETSFKGGFTCNAILILYNGVAGWIPEDIQANGICHEELLVAIENVSGMALAMDLTKYFTLPAEKPAKNNLCQKFYSQHNEFCRKHEGIEIVKYEATQQIYLRRFTPWKTGKSLKHF